jgi:curved DNA-binding protein CbpA
MDHLAAHVIALQVIEAQKNSGNAYDCLLLPRTASFVDVRAAYKRLLFLHPDKNPALDVAHEAFKIVLAAFNEIKVNSQASVPNLAGSINNAAPTGNKWSAYTSTLVGEQATHVDIPRGGIPTSSSHPPPPPQPQPTAWNSSLPRQHSKWGRPSTDVKITRLKVPEPSTSSLKPASAASGFRPQSQDSEDFEKDHHQAGCSTRPEPDLSKPPSGKQFDNDVDDDVIEIDCGSFYGDKSRSAASRRQKPKQQQQGRDSLPLLSRDAAAALPPSAQQQSGWNEGRASKWGDISKHYPLTELLRNPEAATTMATTTSAKEERQAKIMKKRPATSSKAKKNGQKKRQVRTQVVIDSDSDDVFVSFRKKEEEEDEEEDDILGSSDDDDDSVGEGGAGKSSNSSDGWDSKDEESSLKEEIVSEASGEAKSKALIQLLLAQQRSQAKHRLQAGAAGKAQSQRAAFGRRGGTERRQTRLKLAPIRSK